MPGPYCTAPEVSAQISAELGQGANAIEPTHWDPIVKGTVKRAFRRIVNALTKRGYSFAQIDQWYCRKTMNVDLAAAYAMLERAEGNDDDKSALFKNIDLLEKELDDPDLILIGDDGSILVPELVDGLVDSSAGRLTAFDGASAEIERMSGMANRVPKVATTPAPRRDWN